MSEAVRVRSLKTKFGNIDIYTQSMKVKDVLYIYYVAIRGRDDEEGAVQRVLSKIRIKSIKDFILSGNMFFNTFILNWTEESDIPSFNSNYMSIPLIQSAAQVIDGQHRLAGLFEAIKSDDSIGEKDILVSMCLNLSTKEAAKIFLNINSEQKPVPKSLIYDLYNIVLDDKDHAITRANDIAAELNENVDSPYYKAIRYPGAARGAGILDLSTVVSSLKKHLEPNGTFENYKLRDLNVQKQVIINYFEAIKYFYDKQGIWASKYKNPFFQSAGFYAAIDHLASSLLSKCADRKSFKVETYKSLLTLNNVSLLLQSEIKGLDGKTSRRMIKEFLETNLHENLPEQDDYEY